jgi:hypothetical protein
MESVISAVKRAFDSCVSSQKRISQQKEVTIKILAYNLELIQQTIKLSILYIWTKISTAPIIYKALYIALVLYQMVLNGCCEDAGLHKRL